MAFVLSHKQASREAVSPDSSRQRIDNVSTTEHDAAFVQSCRICYEFSHINANLFEEINEGNVVYFKCAFWAVNSQYCKLIHDKET